MLAAFCTCSYFISMHKVREGLDALRPETVREIESELAGEERRRQVKEMKQATILKEIEDEEHRREMERKARM